jgi:hypothetical protein
MESTELGNFADNPVRSGPSGGDMPDQSQPVKAELYISSSLG